VIGWLLGTNVVSELARPGGSPRVEAWARAQDEARMFISVLTLGEYDKGLHNLPQASPARARIAGSIAVIEARFAGRVLGLEDTVVRRWGRISGAAQKATGAPPPVIDTLLAATAIERDLYMVTRNARDFVHSGAAVFDPWTDDPGRFPLA